MRKITFLTIIALLALVGTRASAANTVTIPTAADSYIKWTDGTVNDASKIKEVADLEIGGSYKGGKVTFTLSSSEKSDYTLSFRWGGKNDASVKATIKDADGNTVSSQSVSMTNTGDWTPVDTYTMLLTNIPEGESTLEFEITGPSSGYAGNFDYLKVVEADYSSLDQCPGTITLTKGTYSASNMLENGGANIGYITNGTNATYTFYNQEDAYCNLLMGIKRYGDGNMNVTITDLKTNTVEVNSTVAITSDMKNYAQQEFFMPAKLSKGMKTMKLTFTATNGNTSFICNYKDVSFETVDVSGFAAISSLTIDGEASTEANGVFSKTFDYEYTTTTSTVSLTTIPNEATIKIATAETDATPADDAFVDADKSNISLNVPAVSTTSYTFIRVINGTTTKDYKVVLTRQGKPLIATVTINKAHLSAEDIEELNSSMEVTVDDLTFTNKPSKIIVTDTNGDKYDGTVSDNIGTFVFEGEEYTITIAANCVQLVNTNFEGILSRPSSGVANQTTLASTVSGYGNFILKQVNETGVPDDGQNVKIDGVTYRAFKTSHGQSYQLWNDNENLVIKAITLYGNSNYADDPTYAFTCSNPEVKVISPTYNKLPQKSEEKGPLTFIFEGAQPNDVFTFAQSKTQALVVFFVHYEVKQNVTLREGYASYSPIANVTIPEGVAAWVANSAENGVISFSKVTEPTIKQGTGVIIRADKGNEATSVSFTTTTAEANTASILVGTGADGHVATAADPIYVLNKMNGVIGFYNLKTGNNVGAYKAYLPKSSVSGASGAKGLLFSFEGEDDGTTAINGIETTVDAENNEVYNLQGQRVMNPTKGLYIVNGKKVLYK